MGKAGCLGLLGLGLLAVNPVGGSVSANALEPENDYGISTLSTASTVNISFAPKSTVVGSLLPTTNGSNAAVSVQADVSVTNSGGYRVYVGSEDDKLRSGDHYIDSISEGASCNALPKNTWGYSYSKDTSVSDECQPIGKPLQGDPIDTISDDYEHIPSASSTYTLNFAVNVDTTKPAGTYSNQVTLGVVSSPMRTSIMDVEYMQEVNSLVCADTKEGWTTRLKDKRDEKSYWVAKMKDGNCWMTQDLALELGTSWPSEEDSNIGKNSNTGTATTGKEYVYQFPYSANGVNDGNEVTSGCTSDSDGDKNLDAPGCSDYFRIHRVIRGASLYL